MLFWMQFCLLMTFGWPVDECGAAYLYWFGGKCEYAHLFPSCHVPRIVTQRILCNDAYISFSMFHLFPDITALLLSFGCHICLYALTRVWYMQQSLLCTKTVIYTLVCYSMEYARLFMQQLSWTSSAKLWRANGLHDKSQWSRHGAEWCIV